MSLARPQESVLDIVEPLVIANNISRVVNAEGVCESSSRRTEKGKAAIEPDKAHVFSGQLSPPNYLQVVIDAPAQGIADTARGHKAMGLSFADHHTARGTI